MKEKGTHTRALAYTFIYRPVCVCVCVPAQQVDLLLDFHSPSKRAIVMEGDMKKRESASSSSSFLNLFNGAIFALKMLIPTLR